MYCSNCGKETSGGASFCPYCGAKTAEDMPKLQPRQEAVSQEAVQAAYVGNDRETEGLPVYKRKNKAALIVAFVPLIYAILSSVVLLGASVLGASVLGVSALGVSVRMVPNYTDIPVFSEAILILWGGM